MADVITKCIAANDLRNGALLCNDGSGKGSYFDSRMPPQSGVDSVSTTESKYDNRLDDKSYYTS